MLICLPQEDELITSHVSRLSHLNGMQVEGFLLSITEHGRESKRHSSHPREIFQGVSLLIGTPQEQYLRQHTMLPIDRFAANSDGHVGNFSLPVPHRQRDTLLLINQNLSFCYECAETEVKSKGFSTWRRLHQIHGVDWCLHHGTHLQSVAGPTALNIQPHMAPTEFSLKAKAAPSWIGNVAVHKYGKFCSDMLSSPTRLHKNAISKSLIHHYVENGWTSRHDSVGSRLSDLMKQHYPSDWIFKYFPTLAKKEPGRHHASVDSIVWSVKGIPGTSYAMALSALFDDHADALAHIKNPVMKNRFKGMLSIADMTMLWAKHLGEFAAISAEVGLSISTISSSFRAEGLPSSAQSSLGERRRAAKFLTAAPDAHVEKWLLANQKRFRSRRNPGGMDAIIANAAPFPDES